MNKSKGFTLIELLVVVSIIGLGLLDLLLQPSALLANGHTANIKTHQLLLKNQTISILLTLLNLHLITNTTLNKKQQNSP
jgi:prepilin-type N-terminal cleavage/methylation domain-containing protein